jgi:hypothetical protein
MEEMGLAYSFKSGLHQRWWDQSNEGSQWALLAGMQADHISLRVVDEGDEAVFANGKFFFEDFSAMLGDT